MIEINKEQYKMLKQISRTKILQYDSLSLRQQDLCKFLSEKGFMTAISKSKTVNSEYNFDIAIIYAYEINQSGEAQIYAFKSKFYQIRFSMIMSAISVIISIIALLKS